MDLKDITPDNLWQTLATLAGALGAGSGGHFLAKKLIDKQQYTKIKKLEQKTDEMDVRLTRVENEVEVNFKFDKQFRDQYEKDQSILQDSLKEIKNNQKEMHKYIIELFKAK